jgi:hypothetical protein
VVLFEVMLRAAALARALRPVGGGVFTMVVFKSYRKSGE